MMPLIPHISPGAVVVGVSCDTVETLIRFAEENGLEFPLLSDEVNEWHARMRACVFWGGCVDLMWYLSPSIHRQPPFRLSPSPSPLRRVALFLSRTAPSRKRRRTHGE